MYVHVSLQLLLYNGIITDFRGGSCGKTGADDS